MLPRFLLPAALLATLVLFSPAWGQAPTPASPRVGDSTEEKLTDVISGFDEPEGKEGEAGKQEEESELPADLEKGFDEPPAGEGTTAKAEQAPSIWSLDGFFRAASSYNFAHQAPEAGQADYRGLSKLRTALQLELTIAPSEDWTVFISGQAFRDFAYELNDREMYTQEVLDRYEEESEFREVFVRGSPFAELDIKIGRQIVVWGKSDNIRVTDVLNPIDNREPGVVDIEDIRLPVTMLRLDYYFGDWSLTGIAVHEIRFNKDPAFGSDFFPFPAPSPPAQVPPDGGSNTEFAAALSGIFSGYDLAFYWARIFNDEAHAVSLTGDFDPAVCFSPGGCEFRHARQTMYGAAFNIALGNWLLKSEAAVFDGLRFFPFPGREFTRVDALVGFEYAGIPDNTFSFEAVNRHLLDFEPALLTSPDGTRENVNQYVLAYRADLLRQTLHVVALAIFFGAGADEGGVRRLSGTYDLFDAFSLTAGVVTYHPGNFLLDAAQDNDRLILEAKFSF
jgi:hypothetical protein